MGSEMCIRDRLLYSGLMHSHLVYGLPIWGFSTQGRLHVLLTKQKKAIRKIFNLKYREHTLPFFYEASILKLPDLIKHTALCYVQSALAIDSPYHVRDLWVRKESTRDDLRDRGLQLDYPLSNKQWINNLPPIAQAKLFNSCKLDKTVLPSTFKLDSKRIFIIEYHKEIYQNPSLYEEYIKKKKESVKSINPNDCAIM